MNKLQTIHKSEYQIYKEYFGTCYLEFVYWDFGINHELF